MRRANKVKTLSARVLARKIALTATSASRRSFPAWIQADESDVAFPARVAATPRVRDALVLRTVVARKKTAKAPSAKELSDDRRIR